MFKLWPEDYDWSWHLLRPIAAAVYGGAEFNESYRTAEQIKLRDRGSWHKEWLRTANHVKALAEAAERAGHPVTARDHYLRACIYSRWAEAFLDPADERRLPTYDTCVACFQRAGRSFTPPLEHVEIPYEGSSLPGYFYPGRGTMGNRVAGVLYIAGADVLKEELYFMGGKALTDRGLALLTIDGPGQGTSLRHRKLYTRYDYEVPVRAALDFLQSRAEVDPQRIGIIGRSLGGYYAPRAAAFEPRVKALVVFGGMYYVSEDLPRNLRWQWLIGAKDIEEAREKYRKFTLEGIVAKIRCPMLIVHGEGDHLTPVEHARRMYAEATCPKELVIYPKEGPGAVHCQYDSIPETIPLMMDWLCDRLDHRQG
jgi:dienelactone hydrolase